MELILKKEWKGQTGFRFGIQIQISPSPIRKEQKVHYCVSFKKQKNNISVQPLVSEHASLLKWPPKKPNKVDTLNMHIWPELFLSWTTLLLVEVSAGAGMQEKLPFPAFYGFKTILSSGADLVPFTGINITLNKNTSLFKNMLCIQCVIPERWSISIWKDRWECIFWKDLCSENYCYVLCAYHHGNWNICHWWEGIQHKPFSIFHDVVSSKECYFSV